MILFETIDNLGFRFWEENEAGELWYIHPDLPDEIVLIGLEITETDHFNEPIEGFEGKFVNKDTDDEWDAVTSQDVETFLRKFQLQRARSLGLDPSMPDQFNQAYFFTSRESLENTEYYRALREFFSTVEIYDRNPLQDHDQMMVVFTRKASVLPGEYSIELEESPDGLQVISCRKL
jgi:hypothetical protein